MIKKIKIQESLRDYIERLTYEEARYKDLLNSVKKDSKYISDSEWDDSYNYFSNLYEESKIVLKIALDEVYEIYKDKIQNQLWHIHFTECCIIIGSAYTPDSIITEPYADYLRRLYPKEQIMSLQKNDTKAKDITLQVTDSCNMACSYCYQHDKGNHSMSFETGKKFLDMILDADDKCNSYITSTNCDGAMINFIGGEPWLEIDLISKLSDYFILQLFKRKHPWAIKFNFSVCSNGLLHFDPRVQKYLQEHRNHHGYNISIDGNKELHDSCRVDHRGKGTYDRAIAGVKDFREKYGDMMSSKMTLAPENIDKLYDALVEMIGVNKYNNINLNCVYEKGWTDEHAKIFYWELHKIIDWLFDNNLQYKVSLSLFTQACGIPIPPEETKNWCGGTGMMIALDYKGNIYPCLRYMESSSNLEQPLYIIGNIDEGIGHCKEYCDRIHCLDTITRQSQSTEKCLNCEIAMGCGWCSAYNYEEFGTPNKRATYICDMHHARALANTYYWRKMGINFPLNCSEEWVTKFIGKDEYEKIKMMEVGKNGK